MKLTFRIFFIWLFLSFSHAQILFASASQKGLHQLTDLPIATTNNAVASLSHNGTRYIASFNGLTASKLITGITSDAFLWSSDSGKWQPLPSVPGKGKLASSAVAIGDTFYVIGGYSVAAEGTEISTPEIYSLTFPFKTFQLETNMPVAVDDAVVLVYQHRYLYLVSGWHDSGNVSRVQIYDTKLKNWQQGTAFPGIAVFGHAAAIIGNKMLLVDGVGVVGKIDGKSQFAAIDQSWMGIIDEFQPTQIYWEKIASHPGKAGYRMAGFLHTELQQLVFVGGTDNPYNYDGIGYNGIPSTAKQELLIFDVAKNCWIDNVAGGPAVMDLRGAVRLQQQYWLVGGMVEAQQVSNKTNRLEPRNSESESCLQLKQ